MNFFCIVQDTETFTSTKTKTEQNIEGYFTLTQQSKAYYVRLCIRLHHKRVYEAIEF